MNHLTLSFAPAIFFSALVTFLLSLPGSEFPKETWLTKIWIDKWVHVILFFVLVVIWCRTVAKSIARNSLKKSFSMIALFCFLYGVIMELVQHVFISFRGFEVGDILADGIGAAAGYWFSAKSYIKK